MVKKNYGALEGFQFQVDETLDFICGRKQYLEKDGLWGFLSLTALAVFPAGPPVSAPVVTSPLHTRALPTPAVPAGARLYLVILHITPCSSSAHVLTTNRGEKKRRTKGVWQQHYEKRALEMRAEP